MNLLYTVHLLLLLLFCVYYLPVGQCSRNTNILDEPTDNKARRAMKPNKLGSVVQNILNRHASNSRLENLQTVLADIRPAAIISCNDNDIGIEFDLNDQAWSSKHLPIQRMFTASPENAKHAHDDDDELIETVADVICGEDGPQLTKSRGSKLQWDALGHSLTHADVGHIAPQVSVHQYGTNYFQHNSYTMPSTPSSSLPAAAQNSSGNELNDASKIQSTETENNITTPLNAASLNSPDLNETVDATSEVMMTTVTPSTDKANDSPLENIFIIQRNRMKKIDDTNKQNTNGGHPTVVNVNVSGNGKLKNITSLQQQQQQHLDASIVALNRSLAASHSNKDITNKEMQAQGFLNEDILDNYTRENNAMAANWREAQLEEPATNTTIIDRDFGSQIPIREEKSLENSQQTDVAGQIMTKSSNAMLSQLKMLKKSFIPNILIKPITALPQIKPSHANGNGNGNVTPTLYKGQQRRTAETNYYYYYTKPTGKPNRHLKRIRKPLNVYVEPIMHEALDSAFIIKHSVSVPKHYIAKHRYINNIKSDIGKRTQTESKRPFYHDDDADDEDLHEKCQQDNGNNYMLVKRNRNKSKHIFATEQKEHSADHNVHNYRKSRPFEAALYRHDCQYDESDEQMSENHKPEEQSERNDNRNNNQSECFMCDDNDKNETTEPMALFNSSTEN